MSHESASHSSRSNTEITSQKLKRMSDGAVIKYLSQGLEDGSTDTLPQDVVDQLVERVARMHSTGRVSWHEAGSLFMPMEVGGEKYELGETITTKTYKSIFRVATRNIDEPDYDGIIEGLHQIENIIGQNPQMIHPAQLLDIAAEVRANPAIPNYLSGGVFHSLGYALRFFTETDYEGVIASRLDFDNKENFTKTANFLEMMRDLYNMGDEYSYGDNIVITRVRDALGEAVEEAKGSYLLNIRARHLLEIMDGGEHAWSDRDSVPFEITSGVYAFDRSDGLYIADSSESESISSDIGTLRAIEKKMIESGRVSWSYSDPLMRQRGDLYKRLQNIGTKPLGIQDMSFGIPGRVTSDFVVDYRYLLSKPMREVIRSDFGVELRDLAIQEQFFLLNFLKSVNESDIDDIKAFSHRFGRNGLRTFLAASVDPDIGEEILSFANDGNVDDVNKVFAAFGELADRVDVLQGYLEQEFGIGSVTEIKAIAEKLLLRGRDLLGQAHKYKDDPKKLQQLLEQRSAKGQMLLAMYRYLKEKGEAKTLADIKGVAYETRSSSELMAGGPLFQECIALYKKNWPEAGDALVHDFTENLTKDGGLVRVIQFEGKLVAFMLVTPLDQEKVYLSALNADAEFSTTNVGMLLFADVLAETVGRGKTAQFEALPKRFEQYKWHFQEQYAIEQVGDPYVDPKDQQLTYKAEIRPLAVKDSQ